MKPREKLKYVYNSLQNSKNPRKDIHEEDFEAKLVNFF
jgi:hypothetical protein